MNYEQLPDGWARTTLGNVCRVVSGSTPKTGVPAYWGGDIAWITPDDLSKNRAKVVSRGARSITEQGYQSCSAQLVPPGSILYTSRAPIGYVAIAGGEICTNQGFKSLVLSEGIRSDYLYWYMQYATPSMRSRASGTTFLEVSKRVVEAFPLLVPPTSEQERIAAMIEKLISHLEAGTESLHRAKRQLERLRSLTFPSLLADERWPWTTLGDVAEIVGGVTKDAKRENDPALVEVPYLRVANVQRGYLDLRQVTTIRVPQEKARALELRPGDILFNEGGDRDKLGRGWVWEGQINQCIHQNHVFRARLTSDRFDPRFISMHGNSFGRKWFEKMGKQTTNLASLNLKALKSFPVPAPSLKEQQNAVAEVDRRLTVLDATAMTLSDTERRSGSLRRAVLSRAFCGKLVAQDSENEPAGALLRRLADSLAAGSTALVRDRTGSRR